MEACCLSRVFFLEPLVLAVDVDLLARVILSSLKGEKGGQGFKGGLYTICFKKKKRACRAFLPQNIYKQRFVSLQKRQILLKVHANDRESMPYSWWLYRTMGDDDATVKPHLALLFIE